MENISLRIKELIDDRKLSNSEFAKEIGVNPSIISHILSGRNKVSLQIVEAVKRSFTNVNLDYLLTGSGELFEGVTNVKKPKGDFPDIAQSSGFPMEGVRHAAIPGSVPSASQKAEEIPGQTPPEEKEEAPPYLKSKDFPVSDKAIEQVIIFYKDGSFKVYHPTSS